MKHWREVAAGSDARMSSWLARNEPLTTVLSQRDRERDGVFLHHNESLLYRGRGGLCFVILEPGLHPEVVEELRSAFSRRQRVHSLMGPERSVAMLASTRRPRRIVDYEFMSLPRSDFQTAGPPPLSDLHLRRATPDDLDALTELHYAYELEEVVLPGYPFDRHTSSAGLAASLRDQIVVFAEQRGTVVARAATNARGYTNCQIGGIYTVPTLRGRGVARWVVLWLLDRIGELGASASLFVKPHNQHARTLYRRMGFRFECAFNIGYYV